MSLSTDWPEDAVPPRRLLALALPFEAGAGAIAVGLGWLFHASPLTTLTWNGRDGLAGLAATAPMLALFAALVRSRWRPLVRIRHFLVRGAGTLFGACSLFDLFLVAAAAGFGEELLFRGLIQAALGRWLGPVPALVLASVLFGLAHWITPTYGLLAAVMGAYLGGVWLLSGNLLVPIVAHWIYDLIALAWVVRQWRRRQNRSPIL